VELFFVLSGFLITSLLVEEWAASATVRLRAFWARRARRLLPALFVLVLVIGIYYTAAGSNQAVRRRRAIAQAAAGPPCCQNTSAVWARDRILPASEIPSPEMPAG